MVPPFSPSHKLFTLPTFTCTVVALLETPGGLAYVYDLDTRLEPFPCPAGAYVRKAFKPDLPLREEYRQYVGRTKKRAGRTGEGRNAQE